MSSVHNVRGWGRESKASSGSGLARRATVQTVWGDVLGSFIAATLRAAPKQICLVSPWLAEKEHDRLGRLLGHARRHRAAVTIVTRPSAVASGLALASLLGRESAVRVLVNDQLHAKLYVCQEHDGRGVALVGSANFTAGGARLAEAGVLVRPLADSRIIDDLAKVALSELGARPVVVPVGRKA